jgi:hypothetical protein
MDFQSSKVRRVGLRAGMALKSVSGTNWKRPSNLRSLREHFGQHAQASLLASSPLRGMQSGTARRCADASMTIVGVAWDGAAPAPSRLLRYRGDRDEHAAPPGRGI